LRRRSTGFPETMFNSIVIYGCSSILAISKPAVMVTLQARPHFVLKLRQALFKFLKAFATVIFETNIIVGRAFRNAYLFLPLLWKDGCGYARGSR
jgi:hypothetical protein